MHTHTHARTPTQTPRVVEVQERLTEVLLGGQDMHEVAAKTSEKVPLAQVAHADALRLAEKLPNEHTSQEDAPVPAA